MTSTGGSLPCFVSRALVGRGRKERKRARVFSRLGDVWLQKCGRYGGGLAWRNVQIEIAYMELLILSIEVGRI